MFAILRIGEDEVTNVFLPRRYVNLLNNEQIKVFNERDFKMEYIDVKKSSNYFSISNSHTFFLYNKWRVLKILQKLIG